MCRTKDPEAEGIAKQRRWSCRDKKTKLIKNYCGTSFEWIANWTPCRSLCLCWVCTRVFACVSKQATATFATRSTIQIITYWLLNLFDNKLMQNKWVIYVSHIGCQLWQWRVVGETDTDRITINNILILLRRCRHQHHHSWSASAQTHCWVDK